MKGYKIYNLISLSLVFSVKTTSVAPEAASKVQQLSGDDKVMFEIKRLRVEMENCMDQIRDVQCSASHGEGNTC